MKKLYLFIFSTIIGIALYLYVIFDIIFMPAENLYSNYKTSIYYIATLISLFLLLYLLIDFKEKIKKILFVFTAFCVISPFIFSFIAYSDIKYKKETNYYVLKEFPSGLNITELIYKKSKIFGMAPSGNEEGFYIFKLPDKISTKVNLSFLKNLDNTNEGFDPYRYGSWHQTPIKLTKKNNLSHPYLNKSFRFSFIYPKRDLLKSFYESIEDEGNYYIYQGGGAILVISPKKKIVFYVYKG